MWDVQNWHKIIRESREAHIEGSCTGLVPTLYNTKLSVKNHNNRLNILTAIQSELAWNIELAAVSEHIAIAVLRISQ